MTTHRGLLVFKWLMVLIPPVVFVVGYDFLGHAVGHSLLGVTVGRPAVNLIVASLLFVLTYIFAESVFRVLRRLEAEASAREQTILTMNAVMQERARVSRELHDGAAQLVAHLLLRLDTIKGLVEADRREEVEVELERLHEVANEIYEDIGESITGLRTDVTDRGFVRALREYVEQFEERYRIPVRFRADDAADRLSPLTALQLFRLVQEALTNVRKHSGAREAGVTVTSDGRDLKVVVADDGRGFAPCGPTAGAGRPLGLTSMRERVEALGASMRLQSEPGSGTQVTVRVPMLRGGRERA